MLGAPWLFMAPQKFCGASTPPVGDSTSVTEVVGVLVV
jgi:hypothetical protein